MRVLILPDIHGRSFWKEAVKKHLDDCDKVVFLGDYLDPYGHEGIDYYAAMSNFAQIINFADENKEKVVLLIGNHDAHYISNDAEIGSRYSRWHSSEIRELFMDDIDMFKVAYECTINDKYFLFTHAGVVDLWYNRHKDIIGQLSADNLNGLIKGNGRNYGMLTEIGRERGGWMECGGPMWADIYEHIKNKPIEGIYQIFGHTQLRDKPYITDNFACLDCRKAFILNNEGKIIEV